MTLDPKQVLENAVTIFWKSDLNEKVNMDRFHGLLETYCGLTGEKSGDVALDILFNRKPKA